MKIRRMLAAMLALALTLATAALAAGSADQRLAKVTLAVKKTLDIGDEYTEFYGEPADTMLGTRWELSWSTEEKNLHVSATETGKVLSMNYYEMTDQPGYRGGFGPTFPAMTYQEAQTYAQAFLDKVLESYETPVFPERGSGDFLGADSYSYWGSLELNGIPSPLSFSIQVRLSDGAVTSFWRNDVSQYVGTLPGASSTITAEQAAALLKTTLDLRLEYVREGEGPAVLRYLPEHRDDYYVDAATGKLVNLTELRKSLYETGSGKLEAVPSAAEAPNVSMVAADKGLTEVELSGVAKLEGVLDQDALDKKVKAWTELGLNGFEPVGCSYSVEREDKGGLTPILPRPIFAMTENAVAAGGAEEPDPKDAKVTAHLTYARKVGTGASRRNVTVDAKTGELLSMSGYNVYDETEGKVTKAQARQKAETFLKRLWPEELALCEVYSSTEADSLQASQAWSFTYGQKANGYFFPANSVTVRVCAGDGAVMGFSKNFDRDATFDSPEGIVSKEAALDVWAASYPVELGYIEVPVALDLLGPEVKPLVNAGYRFYNALKPGYALGDQEGWCQGVDAKTGELVRTQPAQEEKMTYDDVAGHWAEEALQELALYRVGWWGGKADPDGALTQLDYLSLLAAADGYRYFPQDEQGADGIYDYAVRRGLLAREDREDERIVTRAEMVRMLLDSLGYKEVANLRGIFRCDFADAAAIPAEQLGYAALAQALGLITGDGVGNYAPQRLSTRGEAAMMLWKHMKR